jgi:hypothetical protein
MKKYLSAIVLLTVSLTACVKDRVSSTGSSTQNNVSTSGDTLMYYWNCNVDSPAILTPTFGVTAGATFSYGGAYYDTAAPGTTINAIGADTILTASSAGLRLRNPASGPLILTLPTTGFKDVVLKFAEERTSKGAQTNVVSYTTDGTNYINTAIASQPYSYTVDTSYQLVSFDFSSDPAVNNNPNFKIMINFSNGSTNTSGNDRLDNITLYGKRN